MKIFLRRPNLKNWSHLSNLRRGSNMVGSTRNSDMCFEIWAGAQLEPVLGGSAMRFKFFKFGFGFSVTKMKGLSRGKCNFYQVYNLKLMLMYSIDTLNQGLSVTVYWAPCSIHSSSLFQILALLDLSWIDHFYLWYHLNSSLQI